MIQRPGPTLGRPQHMCLDKGYAYPEVRELVAMWGYTAQISSRGEERDAKRRLPGYRARRWVVERTHSWVNRFRRLLIRWEKKWTTTWRCCILPARGSLFGPPVLSDRLLVMSGVISYRTGARFHESCWRTMANVAAGPGLFDLGPGISRGVSAGTSHKVSITTGRALSSGPHRSGTESAADWGGHFGIPGVFSDGPKCHHHWQGVERQSRRGSCGRQRRGRIHRRAKRMG